MTYQTREEWLTAALSLIRSQVPAIGSQRIRISCALPSTYNRSGTLSECWPSDASKDGTWEVVISSTLADPAQVFTHLAAMVLHTVPGGASKTSTTYRTAAIDLGLAPADEGWKTINATEDFWLTFGAGLQALGVYPHAEMTVGRKATQTTRMLKLTCPLCGYVLRTSGKWLATGLPTCHDGTQFVPEVTTEEQQ